jgi:hypothetical protein
VVGLGVVGAADPGRPSAAADRETPLAVGDRAPDFTLKDQHDRPVTLSKLIADRDFVVIAFYLKADSPG